MFNALILFLSGRFSGFMSKFTDAFAKGLGRFTMVWGVVLAVAGWVWYIFTKLRAGMSGIASLLNDIVPQSMVPNGGFQQYFDIANTFFPLTETIHYIFLYSQVVIAFAVIRVMKRLAGSLFGMVS